MAVLELAAAGNKETVDAAAWLLHEARSGNVSGLNVTLRRPGGGEAALSTGAYKARPELAVMAAVRLLLMLTKERGK